MNPCTVPCSSAEICYFWAESAEFALCSEEIRCEIRCGRELSGSGEGALLRSSDVTLVNVELLLMEQRIAFHDDGLAGKLFHLLQPARAIGL